MDQPAPVGVSLASSITFSPSLSSEKCKITRIETHARTEVVDPGVYVLDEFLSPAQCLEVIKYAQKTGLEGSGKGYPSSYRRLHRCDFLGDGKFASMMFSRLTRIGSNRTHPKECAFRLKQRLRGAVGINRFWRISRYTETQFFSPHQDGSYTPASDPKLHSELSIVIYLNQDFQGGLTRFFKDITIAGSPGAVIRPKIGSMLIFDHLLWHEGAPVIKGTKWIIRSDIMFDTARPPPSLHPKLSLKTSESKTSESKTSESKTSESKTSESKMSESKTSDSKTSDSKTSDSKASAQGSKNLGTQVTTSESKNTGSHANKEGGMTETVAYGHRNIVWCMSPMYRGGEGGDVAFLSSSRDGYVKIWQSPRKPPVTLGEGKGSIFCVAFAHPDPTPPSGTARGPTHRTRAVLVGGQRNGTLLIWENFPNETKPLKIKKAHSGAILCLRGLRDHHHAGHVLSAGADGFVQMWRVKSEVVTKGGVTSGSMMERVWRTDKRHGDWIWDICILDSKASERLNSEPLDSGLDTETKLGFRYLTASESGEVGYWEGKRNLGMFRFGSGPERNSPILALKRLYVSPLDSEAIVVCGNRNGTIFVLSIKASSKPQVSLVQAFPSSHTRAILALEALPHTFKPNFKPTNTSIINSVEIESEGKTVTETEGKTVTETEGKGVTESEGKRETESEGRRETENEGRRETENEDKRVTENEDKRVTESDGFTIGIRIVTGGEDAQVKLWVLHLRTSKDPKKRGINGASLRLERVFRHHTNFVTGLLFRQSGLVSCSYDGSVQLLDL
ncbi:hypothetical protein AAMO2058_001633500 [Amorphochlora amoebiformis]